MLLRRMLIWRRVKLRKCLCVYVLLVSVSLLVFFTRLRIDVSHWTFHESDKCPACFGDSLCPAFSNRTLKLSGLSHLAIMQVLNAKNVYFGELARRKVVLKKLAHDFELRDSDVKLCRVSSMPICDARKAVEHLSDVVRRNFSAEVLSFVKRIKSLQDLTSCPSVRLLKLILRAVRKRAHAHTGTRHVLETVLYTLVVNAEPLILQAFPRTEGWPFPKYYGSCGRVIVEEYVGQPLTMFENRSWLVRVHLADQLLEIAQKFTENGSGFALYLVDVSMDNFAVSSEGRVLVIDAENIIILDQQSIRRSSNSTWKEYHSLIKGCTDCLSFSTEDLCSHYTSDHNYYAICSGILASDAYYSTVGGFLHSMPETLEKRYRLMDLVSACANSHVNLSRSESVVKLRRTFSKILNSYAFNISFYNLPGQ